MYQPSRQQLKQIIWSKSWKMYRVVAWLFDGYCGGIYSASQNTKYMRCWSVIYCHCLIHSAVLHEPKSRFLFQLRGMVERFVTVIKVDLKTWRFDKKSCEVFFQRYHPRVQPGWLLSQWRGGARDVLCDLASLICHLKQQQDKSWKVLSSKVYSRILIRIFRG